MAGMTDGALPIGHELIEGEAHHAITVYGAAWCEDTERSRALLDRLNIQYNYYDVDKDAAMKRTAMDLQNGGEKTPVVDFHDGTVLVEPDDAMLMALLERKQRLPMAPS